MPGKPTNGTNKCPGRYRLAGELLSGMLVINGFHARLTLLIFHLCSNADQLIDSIIEIFSTTASDYSDTGIYSVDLMVS